MEFTTRKARLQDLKDLDALYTRNMKQYVEQYCSWDPHMFRSSFEPNSVQIVEVNGLLAGFIKLVYQRDEMYLAEIQLDKNFRNYGIGTTLIHRIIVESERSGTLITLKVIRGNPAEFLYKRLGFRVYETSFMHLKMSRLPG